MENIKALTPNPCILSSRGEGDQLSKTERGTIARLTNREQKGTSRRKQLHRKHLHQIAKTTTSVRYTLLAGSLLRARRH